MESVSTPTAHEHHTTPSDGRDTAVQSWQVDQNFGKITEFYLGILLQTSGFRSRGLHITLPTWYSTKR